MQYDIEILPEGSCKENLFRCWLLLYTIRVPRRLKTLWTSVHRSVVQTPSLAQTLLRFQRTKFTILPRLYPSIQNSVLQLSLKKLCPPSWTKHLRVRCICYRACLQADRANLPPRAIVESAFQQFSNNAEILDVDRWENIATFFPFLVRFGRERLLYNFLRTTFLHKDTFSSSRGL